MNGMRKSGESASEFAVLILGFLGLQPFQRRGKLFAVVDDCPFEVFVGYRSIGAGSGKDNLYVSTLHIS
jgi:hypothetical protein